MKETDKLKLRKPEPTDYVDIVDFNHNADGFDAAVGGLIDGTVQAGSAARSDHADDADKLGGKSPSYYATKAEVDAKETPSGAQAKADAALSSAKSYTDGAYAEITEAEHQCRHGYHSTGHNGAACQVHSG